MRSIEGSQQDTGHGEAPVIGELEEAFVRACPSFEGPLKQLREDHKLFGSDLQTELPEILDKLGFHLGSTAKQAPTREMIQVLKVVERVLMDGSEQQKWAVTHFLMTSLQTSMKDAGHRTDALLPHLGPATASWWNDLSKNPPAAEVWK